jgi:hypothetical protein
MRVRRRAYENTKAKANGASTLGGCGAGERVGFPWETQWEAPRVDKEEREGGQKKNRKGEKIKKKKERKKKIKTSQTFHFFLTRNCLVKDFTKLFRLRQ